MQRLLAVTFMAVAACTMGCTGTAIVGQAPGGAAIVRVPLRLSNVHVVTSTPPVLIDSGTIGDMKELETALSDYGVRKSDLGLVVVTHGHADHAGLAADLRRTTRARVMLGAGDLELARVGHNDELRPTSFTARLLEPFIPDVYPTFQPDITVRVGQPVELGAWGVDGKAIAMPGHTAGSIVVVLSDHSAFVGDMLAGGVLGGQLAPSSPVEHYYHAIARRTAATSGRCSTRASRSSTSDTAGRSRART